MLGVLLGGMNRKISRTMQLIRNSKSSRHCDVDVHYSSIGKYDDDKF